MKPRPAQRCDVPLYRWRMQDWVALGAPPVLGAAAVSVVTPWSGAVAAAVWIALGCLAVLWYAVLPRRPVSVRGTQLIRRGLRVTALDLGTLAEVLVLRRDGGTVELGFGRRVWIPVAGVRRNGRAWSAPAAGFAALAAGLRTSPYDGAQAAADLLQQQSEHVDGAEGMAESPLLTEAGPAPRRRLLGLGG